MARCPAIGAAQLNFPKPLAPGPNHERTLTEKLDIDHLRQWIGRTTEASDIVTAQLVKGLRATLFQEIGEPKAGDAAPFTTHWCLAQPVFPMSQLGPDGHPTRGGFLPPVPLPRRMWAGGELEFLDTLRVGDETKRSSRISDVTMKTGSTGALCFVSVEHLIDDAARHGDPRAAGHRLSRCLRRVAGGTCQGAAAAAGRKSSRKPHGRSRAAVPLFGADLQRPSYPLRPRLRHQGRGLSRPRLPWPAAGRIASSNSPPSCMAATAPKKFSYRGVQPLVRGQRVLGQCQRERDRHGIVDREFAGTADDEGYSDVVNPPSLLRRFAPCNDVDEDAALSRKPTKTTTTSITVKDATFEPAARVRHQEAYSAIPARPNCHS